MSAPSKSAPPSKSPAEAAPPPPEAPPGKSNGASAAPAPDAAAKAKAKAPAGERARAITVTPPLATRLREVLTRKVGLEQRLGQAVRAFAQQEELFAARRRELLQLLGDAEHLSAAAQQELAESYREQIQGRPWNYDVAAGKILFID